MAGRTATRQTVGAKLSAPLAKMIRLPRKKTDTFSLELSEDIMHLRVLFEGQNFT